MKDNELSDRVMLQRMEKGWQNGLSEGTPCGKGSTLKGSQEIRELLPRIITNYKITSIADAGCGDKNWIKTIDFCGASYQGFDLVKRHESTIVLDITKEVLPGHFDLIICRDVFIHLTVNRILFAIKNFKSSGKYLLTSSYKKNDNHLISVDRGFTKISLTNNPFNFPEPLLKIEENMFDRWLCLWELNNL